MSQAQQGNSVKVHYTGKFEDGTTFDSSRGRDPLELTLGAGDVIPGFETSIVGMQAGETKEIRLEPHEAYGERQEELLQSVERSQIPPDLELEVGRQLQVTTQEGDITVVTIADLSDEAVTLDGNHPLAGRNLVFEIELVQIS